MKGLKYCDLHIHSSFSDGKLTPEEIVDKATEKGVKCISITDHDNIDSQYICRNYYRELVIVPGIELSTEINGIEIHILGYFIDIDNENLIKAVEDLKRARVDRAIRIVSKLKSLGIDVDLDNIIKNGGETVGRAHIANEIVSTGYESNYKSAFNKYLIQGKPAYEKGKKLTYKEALKLVNDSGGIAVLAHPGKIYRRFEVEKIIKELKYYGLSGIEVYHSSHSPSQTNLFYNLSKKYKLLITGGSDFHCDKSECGIGSEGISEELFNKLIRIYNEKKGRN